ncbi:MAG TPA: hypothetical protein VKM94_11475 [Blastocatellia bacterium]|nr:hypothetical protein [Blastocatellia bacterium]
MTVGQTNNHPRTNYNSLSDIPRFPFEQFDELQAAVAARSFNVGVDSFAAAEWANREASRVRKIIVALLSLLLLVAAAASVGAALLTKNYWLLLAIPVQAFSFYLSQPSSPIRKWVTLAGALSLAVFLDFLLNRWVTAATLVAYAGLTFASVRAAAFINNSAFRKAVLSDEQMFLSVYSRGACSLRNNRTGQEHRV